MKIETSQDDSGNRKVPGVYEVEDRAVLGFDTGLDNAAFAQAKLAQLLTDPGFIVSPRGEVTPWRAEGVMELEGRMVIWGPAFAGERFDRIIDRGGPEALDALRSWMSGRVILSDADEARGRGLPAPYPAGAFMGVDGTVLFAPERLTLRSLDALGPLERLNGAERWTHPDLSGEAAEAFTSAALAYRILTGVAPFAAGNADSVRADMRDGCALSAKLAEPALTIELANLIDASIASEATPRSGPGRTHTAPKARNASSRPSVAELAAAIGPKGSGGIERFIRTLTEEERAAAAIERTRQTRSRDAKVGTRRFVRRNATIIASVLVAVVGVFLIARSIIAGRAEQPTTAGMSPRQVAQAYYGAFGKLDHTFMEACVVDKAGAGDINSAMNLFVISRVRMAYERQSSFMSADEWIAQGSKPVPATVYGVTDLGIDDLETDESDGVVTLRVHYVLWMPAEGPATPPGESPAPEPNKPGVAAGATADAAGAPAAATDLQAGPPAVMAPPPVAERREDTLTIVHRKGLWRISKIDRKTID
jgi:hypothetical protein